MGEERLVTAGIVLAGSLALSAGGLLLLSIGGLATVGAIVLLGLGVSGCVQAIGIALARRRRLGPTADEQVKDERSRLG